MELYIRPKLLWWGLPAFLALFLLGVALGSVGSRENTEELSADTAKEKRQEETLPLSGLLDQLTHKGERSFIVNMQEYVLNGTYNQEQFHLKGVIGGHELEMKRDDQQRVTVLIDGNVQDHSALPYALYTPHEHAQLLKGVLHSVIATPLQQKSDQGWRGFRLSVPSQEVTTLLDMWLGPSFSIKEIAPEAAKKIAVDYQLWYDEQSGRVRQLDLELQIRTAAGEKRDTLRFRL
jgi:hypothetical protein